MRLSFEYYVEQFYKSNLQVRNKLHRLVTGLKFPRAAPNILNDVLASRKARYVRRASPKDFRGLPGLARRMTREFIVAPLATAHEEIGVILADNFFTRRSLSPEDAVALHTTCNFAATMIAGAREFEQSEFHAQGDPLTQVYNFRYLRQVLTHEISRCDRYGRKMTLAMADVENFADFTMTHGHLCGNKALMDVASLIKKHIRCVDYVGRHSGARFVLLLPETDKNGAAKAAEKIRGIVRKARFVGSAGRSRRKLAVTISTATYPDDAANAAGLIEAAERSLAADFGAP